MEEKKKHVLTFEQIRELLPHRPPLLLVDRVLEISHGESIHALKCVSGLDPYFAGHFPNMPVVPGVYLVEGLAQTTALLCFMTFEHRGEPYEKKCMLTSIEEAKFRRPVVPGDVLHYYAKYERNRGPFYWFSGQVKVDDEVVAEARISAVLSPTSKAKGTGA